MGVLVGRQALIDAPVSAVHYSKNIPLIDFTTPHTYLERLSKVNVNQILDLNQTDFRNEGHSLKYRANSFEIAFYDKLKDLDKAKISDKRSEERENAIQLDLFDRLNLRKPFEVLRMEIRLNKRQKVEQVLRAVGIDEEPTFRSVFHKDISQKVLLYYLDQLEAGYPPLLLYNSSGPKEFLQELIKNNSRIKLRKALQLVGLWQLFTVVGVREFREITKRFGRNNWYRLNKELSLVKRPRGVKPFETLRTVLKEFRPLKLLDFQSGMLNNDKYEKRTIPNHRRSCKDVKGCLPNRLPLDTGG